MSTQGHRGPGGDVGADCWCGDGSLTKVTVGGVAYLHCSSCGGELGGRR